MYFLRCNKWLNLPVEIQKKVTKIISDMNVQKADTGIVNLKKKKKKKIYIYIYIYIYIIMCEKYSSANRNNLNS